MILTYGCNRVSIDDDNLLIFEGGKLIDISDYSPLTFPEPETSEEEEICNLSFQKVKEAFQENNFEQFEKAVCTWIESLKMIHFDYDPYVGWYPLSPIYNFVSKVQNLEKELKKRYELNKIREYLENGGDVGLEI